MKQATTMPIRDNLMPKSKTRATKKISNLNASKRNKSAKKSQIDLNKLPKGAHRPLDKAYSTKDTVKLQRAWYKRIAKESEPGAEDGFKDLERFMHGTTEALHMLHGASMRNIATQFSTERRHYYRLWTCFYVHNQSGLDKRTRLIIRMHSEGATMREIIAAVNAQFDKKISLNPLHHIIKELNKRIMRWNKVSPKGLDFQADIE